MTHRWSGWPGAWCLDCGADDPMELALADDQWDFEKNDFASPEAREKYSVKECAEPNSKRHDPYAARDTKTE